MTDRFAEARRAMVAQLVARGIADARVLDAMSTVRREQYVDAAQAADAYADRPLAIGSGQTISQPYIVGRMAEAAEVEPSDRVLEVGTGSGYGAAVLGSLAGEVLTIERQRKLADRARTCLRADGFDHVNVVVGDGSHGWAPAGPYQAIVVTACPPQIPPALLDQLADGGRLVTPVGPRRAIQVLVRVRRAGEHFRREDLGAVRFVPLIADR